MEKNYYEVLGVTADASFADLAKRFKVLAMTYHPELNPNDMAQANFKFTEICEAFEVLSTRKFLARISNKLFSYNWQIDLNSLIWLCVTIADLRQIYDRYGEKTLKNGVPGAGKLDNDRDDQEF